MFGVADLDYSGSDFGLSTCGEAPSVFFDAMDKPEVLMRTVVRIFGRLRPRNPSRTTRFRKVEAKATAFLPNPAPPPFGLERRPMPPRPMELR